MKSIFPFVLAAAFISITPAHSAEPAKRCWGGTAPSEDQYYEKLKVRDSCEDFRVPDSCEIKVVQAVSKKLGSKLSLNSITMNDENPFSLIDLEVLKGDCEGAGQVTVKYDYNGCTIQKVEMPDDYDCG